MFKKIILFTVIMIIFSGCAALPFLSSMLDNDPYIDDNINSTIQLAEIINNAIGSYNNCSQDIANWTNCYNNQFNNYEGS